MAHEHWYIGREAGLMCMEEAYARLISTEHRWDISEQRGGWGLSSEIGRDE